MGRRFARLCRRIGSTTQAIVWLRGMPGTGKSRLLLEMVRHAAAMPVEHWVLLDDPSPEALRHALAARGVSGRSRRFLVASRSRGAVADVLLTPRLYGEVDLIEDAELFLVAADCRAADRALFAASGGWPVLADGLAAGRTLEMMQMLPAFLDREVLPDLPPAVVTALFGALPAPLGTAAAEYLFGVERVLHPLLQTTPRGVVVAGLWVREALLKLRTQPKALGRAVLDDLVHLFTRYAEPSNAIMALIDVGQIAQAIEVFNAAGGMFFGYHHGYQALGAVLERFGAEWERRTESLFFARLHLLIKSGQPREALLRLEAQYAGLPVDLRRLRLSHRPYAVLIRLDISLDLDEAPPLAVVSSWGRLEAFLAPGDDLARGILYNTMAIGFLRAGALLQAQELAEEALAAYRRAKSPYLMHFMWLHLCDVSLRRGRPRQAAEQLHSAVKALNVSRLAFNSEPAIIECFKARIAYEEARFADCPADIEPILAALLRGDSWSDLISAVASHFVLAAFWQQGLRKALDRVDQLALTLSRRHGPTQNRSIDLIRIRLYQAARRHEEAAARLEEYDVVERPRGFSPPDAEEGLVRLRQQIVEKLPLATSLKTAARFAGVPELEARQAIALSILQAYLQQRHAQPGAARRYLTVALRAAEREGLLAVLVEYGEFLEPLLPLVAAKSGPDNAQLQTFVERVARLLRTLPAMPLYSKALAGVTRQEHRVLSYVSDGYTNKQIARALALSESAVKFHLRGLFRKFAVGSRAALSEASARRNIRT